jgi:ubiquinone/menaquinone biosynthesis C-methylase UbiE
MALGSTNSTNCYEKALGAMRRVLKEDGVVILILPMKEECFDHLRGFGRLEEIMYRYLHDVSESDMRHARVDAVTLQSDLARDPPAGTWEQFRARCSRNVANRGIHQFVYNFELLERMGRLLGFEVLFLGTKGLDQWIVLQKTKRHRI